MNVSFVGHGPVSDLTFVQSLDHKIVSYGILAQEWPFIGGNEYAGTVCSIGPGVENLKVGDRIAATAVNFIEG